MIIPVSSITQTRGKNTIFTAVFQHKKILFAGGLLVAATTFANVLNFVFSVYAGRTLSLTDFALVSLMGSFYAFSSLFFGPLSITVNYRSGYLIGKYHDGAGYSFWKHIRKYALYYGIGFCCFWLIISPLLNVFFQTENLLLFVSFTVIIFGGFAAGVDKGFLSAKLFFGPLAAVVLAEPVLKILIAIMFVLFHLQNVLYLTIPLSFLGAFLLGWLFILLQKKQRDTVIYPQREQNYFPKKFFFISLLSGLSTLSFVSLDIVLAKHYLSAHDAGEYALVSLVGKSIFFLGGLASPFVIPLVSRDLGANKNTQQTLVLLVLITFLLSFSGFLFFGVFGYWTVPFILGEKAQTIIPYLSLFLFAMMCFTVSQIFTTFYQMRKLYSFPIAGFLLSILQIILIVLSHASVFSLVLSMSIVGIVNLLVMSLMHFQREAVRVFENRIVEFMGGKTKNKKLVLGI